MWDGERPVERSSIFSAAGLTKPRLTKPRLTKPRLTKPIGHSAPGAVSASLLPRAHHSAPGAVEASPLLQCPFHPISDAPPAVMRGLMSVALGFQLARDDAVVPSRAFELLLGRWRRRRWLGSLGRPSRLGAMLGARLCLRVRRRRGRRLDPNALSIGALAQVFIVTTEGLLCDRGAVAGK